MRTLVLDPPPPEVEALLERRRRRGADKHDEVWEGVLHMSPPPSARHEFVVTAFSDLLRPYAERAGLGRMTAAGIGTMDDHRVPDLALLRPPVQPQWQPSAALIVEVLSPDDETWDKLPFYAAHDVDELVVADPASRETQWFALVNDEYRRVDRSSILDVEVRELVAQIDWPE